MKSRAQMNVVLVFANPVTTGRLRLDTEAREIQQSIERSKYRDNITLVPMQATTIKDLRRALLDKAFQIIHTIFVFVLVWIDRFIRGGVWHTSKRMKMQLQITTTNAAPQIQDSRVPVDLLFRA